MNEEPEEPAGPRVSTATVIIQTPAPGFQIASVITYTDLHAAADDYLHAILEGEPGSIVSMYYSSQAGEPTLKVSPVAREQPVRPCQNLN